MKQLAPPPPHDEVSSAIHMEFIENAAALGTPDGPADVAGYHEALFLHRHGRDLDRWVQQARIQEDRLAYLETRLASANRQLVDRERLIPAGSASDQEPTPPWNRWDAAMFAVSLMGIVTLLVFGVFNISFNLLESGLVTFLEHPVRAYFWAALLPVGALAVKVGWDLLESPRRREWYLWTCLALGLAGVVAWVAAYAAIYPTLSITTGETLARLSVFGDGPDGGQGLLPGGSRWMDMLIVSAQAVAEICLSAVLGMYMTRIYMRHRRVRLTENPAFVQLEEDRRRLEEEVATARLALAEARGQEGQLRNQLTAFVAFAKSLYQKEVSAQGDRSRQKHRMLEQLSRQIRTQLEAAELPEETAEGTPSLPFPKPSAP